MKPLRVLAPKNASPTASPSNQPKLSRSERERLEVEQRINEILFHSMQLQRTLWLAAMAAGGTVVVNEQNVNPRWNLEFSRAPNDKNLLVISAGLLPELTAEQLAKLEQALLGTKNDPGPIMDELKLGDYPKSYIVGALQSRIIFTPEHGWITRAAFDQLPKTQEPPQPQPPKPDAV